MKRETFICYSDWYDYCDGMTSEQKANLFDCIRSYTRVGNSIQPLPEIQFVRNRIKKQLDDHNEKYLEVCKKASESVKKRREKAKEKETIPTNTNVYERIPSNEKQYEGIRSILDTDTVTDTVNGNDISSTIVEQAKPEILKEEKKTFGRETINGIIGEIKKTCDELGVAYDNTMEREFAKHLATAKEFGSFCDKIGASRKDFTTGIVRASVEFKYWKGPCAGPKSIYQNYADVYNKTKQQTEKQSNFILDPTKL